MLSPETRRAICQAAGVDETCDTDEAAALLGRAPQTLRKWACKSGNGPIEPRRVGHNLRWSLREIRALLGSSTPSAAA